MVQQQQQQQSPLIKTKKKSITKNGRESKTAGSRRIFSPLFKLQVLDSYRQDADCQGNQRATARKYGIHRRQIQKWLQMETNLRLTVAQSNVSSALNLTSSKQPEVSKVSNIKADIKSENLLSEDKHSPSALKKEYNSDEEYVNVDEISDSEDDETSSCSSYEKNDKALDFTCATLSKRRFYTSDFKLHVIEAFKSNESCKGNQRATARKFGIHRRQVQKWLNQEDLIKSEQLPCLDLSHKRKMQDPEECAAKRKALETPTPPTALCVVKNEIEPWELNNNTYHRVIYPSPTYEHSFGASSPLNYVHDYPLCVYQPWSCYYPPISRLRSESLPPKYSYSFAMKYDTSYVDMPVQYGFGDTFSSKWVKENPLYLHEHPNIPLLSSYR